MTLPRNAGHPEGAAESGCPRPVSPKLDISFEAYRDRVVQYARDNGVLATSKASGIGKSTIYRWLSGDFKGGI